MKLSLLTIATILCLTASVAHADDRVIHGQGQYGCTDEAYYNKTGELVAQNDREAFRKMLSAGIESGVCTMFKDSESVVVVKGGLYNSKVRRRGDLKEYWIESKAFFAAQ